jgi:cellulose synthase/poly-beta-1,6-N-acetylglucosamine synthase-like glycosyltransferase
MGVQYQAFVGSEPTAVAGSDNDIAIQIPVVLPEVPQMMMRRLLRHMNAAELSNALQRRLVPITWLPHMTLYADAAPSEQWRAWPPTKMSEHVVARIASEQFHASVRQFLRPKLLDEAIHGLRRKFPTLSADHRLSDGQILFAIVSIFLFISLVWLVPFNVIFIGMGIGFTALFWSGMWLRLLALSEAAPASRAAIELDDRELPSYSVLVPAFRETRVLPQIIGAMCSLNYPREKLDIKLILEETDTAMQRAVAKMALPEFIEVLVVPAGAPQTKPRALNYALQFARGSLLTIYDAEDIPEPMQLRAAAKAFAQAPATLACLQAELAFYNPNENWLTRQFTVEYASLFKLLLPTLAKFQLPMPLSGTSNHFRTAALRMVGGWDSYNVTEDADLGFRLARFGFGAGCLGSITYEEANMQLRNWLHQRARWLKGFLQTWLVHMRHPLMLISETGLGGFMMLQAMVLSVFVSATLQPVFLLPTLATLTSDLLASAHQGIFLVITHSLFLGSMLIGCGLSIVNGALALRRKGLMGFGWTLMTMPIYWLLANIAGWMALWQFIRHPFHWNKTRHGLSRVMR